MYVLQCVEDFNILHLDNFFQNQYMKCGVMYSSKLTSTGMLWLSNKETKRIKRKHNTNWVDRKRKEPVNDDIVCRTGFPGMFQRG